jgi:dihydroorotase
VTEQYPVIDAHVHLFGDISPVGADVDRYLTDVACDVLVEGGTFGPDIFGLFEDAVRRRTGGPRIVGMVNIARLGLTRIPEITVPDDFQPERAAEVAASSPIGVGLKMRLTRASWDVVGEDLVERTCAAAEQASIPVVVHLGEHAPGVAGDDVIPAERVIDRLKRGDVVTHVFSARPGGVFGSRSGVEAALAARRRGVLFDVGHGAFNFDIGVARRAIADGFEPDLIGSDVTAQTQGRVDLYRTIEACIAAGLDPGRALTAVTSTPARWLADHGVEVQGGTRLGLRDDPATRTDSSGTEYVARTRVHVVDAAQV